ncbi:fructosamine kinase family protein [Shimia biformata]|uniref:fructosamine kinase family protein n=1 Tax=Shimia biformata TaxID=1294299 RepID=UPI001951D089|nr:fructosamine kinase family protein [Shimia biformata]
MTDPVHQTVETLLGVRVASARPLHGGDLSQVQRLTLTDGRRIVAKTGPLVVEEARMLRDIRAANAPAPRVLAARDTVLVMEFLPEAQAHAKGWTALGEGLRHLHSALGDSFGWDRDYAFGDVAIPNTRHRNWATFWGDTRIRPSLFALPAPLARRAETLIDALPDLLPKAPPAALLHGDLWAGNVLFTADAAFLIDPACYHGDREVDLAMLTLFATPHPAFWQAYGALEPGWERRRAIYQLWPALVHLRLFGGSYQSMVDAKLDAAGF